MLKTFIEPLETRHLLSQSYYVDVNAAPNGDGSLASPWQSIQQVNAFGATTGFQFGDHIRFHGGETFSGQLILGQNGTRANPITVNSYARGAGNATIDAGNGSGITARDVSGIVIANLTIVGESQADPLADATEISAAAGSGDTSIQVTDATGLTPGQQLDIDRFTDGANTHFYEEAFVAYNYVPGSTTVPLQQPLLFNHASGTSVNWDVHDGIAFVADDGNQHPRGVTIHGVTVTGISGVWPSAGIAFMGDGIRDGNGIDPKSGSHIGYSVADSGYQTVVVRSVIAARDGPTGILFGGNTFLGSQDLNKYANFNLRVVHAIVHRSAFPSQAVADASAAMEGPLHIQTGESGILVYDSQAVFINQVQTLHNGLYGNGGGGIEAFRSDSVAIAHVESAFNITNGTLGGHGFDLDGGVTDSIVEYSYSHDNSGAGFALNEFSGFNGIAPANSGNTYRFNVSQDDARANGDGAISAVNAQGNNLLTGDQVYGNTVYVSPASSGAQPVVVQINGTTTALLLLDNIFYAVSGSGMSVAMASVNASQALTKSNVKFLRNAYWAVGASAGDTLVTYNGVAYQDLSSWEQQTKQETRNGTAIGLSLDPMLKAAGNGGTLGDGTPLNAGILNGLVPYRIQPTSPLLGLGLDPATLNIDSGGSDFYGHLLPPVGGYAIGADQR